jgi:Mor family transcriptional regulator
MWEEYKEGKVSMWKLEEKYGVGMQWVYKVADESSYERRRPDKIVRIWKRKLTPELEKAAWKEYEAGKKTVVSILKKYKINNSTLYDIGDRLGSTFRRHKSIAGEAVKSRWRYARNQRGVPHPSVEPEASVD